jgi:hypothetical protein
MWKPTRYRDWFLLTWVIVFCIPGACHFLFLIGSGRWDELRRLGRGSLGLVAVLLLIRGFAAIHRRWWPAEAKPQKSPQEEDWEFVEGASLGLQIVTAPFALTSLAALIGNQLSGKAWDDGEWLRVGLLCGVLFVAMQLWRDHARKRIGPKSPASAP